MTYRRVDYLKYLGLDTSSAETALHGLRAYAEEVEEMMATGLVTYDAESSQANDGWLFFETEDPVMAQKYGFNEEDPDEFADEEEEGEDDFFGLVDDDDTDDPVVVE